jgi:hypothetical protein
MFLVGQDTPNLGGKYEALIPSEIVGAHCGVFVIADYDGFSF